MFLLKIGLMLLISLVTRLYRLQFFRNCCFPLIYLRNVFRLLLGVGCIVVKRFISEHIITTSLVNAGQNFSLQAIEYFVAFNCKLQMPVLV